MTGCVNDRSRGIVNAAQLQIAQPILNRNHPWNSSKKGKGSPYSIAERKVPESAADPGSWQSACR